MAIDLMKADDTVHSGFWHAETDDKLLCVDVHDETHDVKSFTFVCPDR